MMLFESPPVFAFDADSLDVFQVDCLLNIRWFISLLLPVQQKVNTATIKLSFDQWDPLIHCADIVKQKLRSLLDLWTTSWLSQFMHKFPETKVIFTLKYCIQYFIQCILWARQSSTFHKGFPSLGFRRKQSAHLWSFQFPNEYLQCCYKQHSTWCLHVNLLLALLKKHLLQLSK